MQSDQPTAEVLIDALRALPPAIAPIARSGGVSGGRRIIVVLGMHRSGTSLLSNALHYLGADLADKTDQISPKNPGGFWERPAITAIHDEILDEIGLPIDHPRHSLPFPAGWWRRKGVQAQKRRLRAIVADHLSQCPGLWGFKDPRTSRLLPLWWEIFEELGLQAEYAWAVRSPGEASASMANKNPLLRPMTPALAEVTWLAYNYDVLRYTNASNRKTIVYSDWFSDPVGQADRLRASFDLPGLARETEMSACMRGIVEETFRHHREGDGDAVSQIALAQSLFQEIVSAESADRLSRYLSVLDVVFRALSPFVDLLTELPHLRHDLRITKKQLAKFSATPDTRTIQQAPRNKA